MKQDLYEVSPAGQPAYTPGFRFPISDPEDSREFRYGISGGTLTPDMGAKIGCVQHVSYAVVANAPKGARQLVVTVGVGDGFAHNGNIAVNELAGGYITLFTGVGGQAVTMFLKKTASIPANTAVGGGGAMTINLDRPIPMALTTTSVCEIMASPFFNLRQDAWTYWTRTPVKGMPMANAVIGQGLWFQIRGPRWIAPQANVGVGDHNVEVVFRYDGSLDRHAYGDAYLTYQQHAGYVMTVPNGSGQAAPFIFLEIE